MWSSSETPPAYAPSPLPSPGKSAAEAPPAYTNRVSEGIVRSVWCRLGQHVKHSWRMISALSYTSTTGMYTVCVHAEIRCVYTPTCITGLILFKGYSVRSKLARHSSYWKINKLLQALIPTEMFPWFILRREHSPAVLTATQTLQRCARAWEPERKLKNLFSLLQKRNTESKQTAKALTNKFDSSLGCSVIYTMAKETRLEACMFF